MRLQKSKWPEPGIWSLHWHQSKHEIDGGMARNIQYLQDESGMVPSSPRITWKLSNPNEFLFWLRGSLPKCLSELKISPDFRWPWYIQSIDKKPGKKLSVFWTATAGSWLVYLVWRGIYNVWKWIYKKRILHFVKLYCENILLQPNFTITKQIKSVIILKCNLRN